jgi:UDP-N-acetylglucosamine acyltransferase
VRNAVASFSGRGVFIHPTAIVDRNASLGVDVEIGPYAVVEAGVRLGDRVSVLASAFITGSTEIGADCEVHVAAVVGHAPQIRGFVGPGGGLTIGPRTVVREHATIHRASRPGTETSVGADCFLMAGCHVAHDCRIGSGVTIANGALLAGCVTLGDKVFISGNVVVHQYVRIGDLAMIGGLSRVSKDVPPFTLVVGDSKVCGVNVIGMRRAGLPAAARQSVRRAYAVLYRSGLSTSHAVERLRTEPPSPELETLLSFIAGSTRGLCAARKTSRVESVESLPEAT